MLFTSPRAPTHTHTLHINNRLSCIIMIIRKCFNSEWNTLQQSQFFNFQLMLWTVVSIFGRTMNLCQETALADSGGWLLCFEYRPYDRYMTQSRNWYQVVRSAAILSLAGLQLHNLQYKWQPTLTQPLHDMQDKDKNNPFQNRFRNRSSHQWRNTIPSNNLGRFLNEAHVL